VASHEGTVAP